MLVIKNLEASVENNQILKGVDLVVGPGEMHVLMGPNGSGKSTLAQVIAGHPSYKVNPTSSVRLPSTALRTGRSGLRGASSSSITFDGKDINKLTPDKRAKLGIFLGFQHPVEVPGVSVFNFLRRAKQSQPSLSLRADSVNSPQAPRSNLDSEQALRLRSGRARMTKKKIATSSSTPRNDISRFREELLEYASSLKLSDDFLRRSLNEGFSGGEKKRNEILQMMALKPKLVILDEIDSGLDVDGLRIVADAIKRFTINNPRSSVILITHYARILKYLAPGFVHVMVEGKIVKSGNAKLAREIEERGYQYLQPILSS